MDLRLSPLYHWSPAERRPAIQREGLRLHQAATVCSDPGLTSPYLSLGPSPAQAWVLSGDMEHVAEIEEWDLWEVRLGDHDEVRVRSEFGPVVREVKLYSPVPPDRIWWVGRRTIPVFEPRDEG